MNEIKITFLHEKKTVYVPKGTSIKEAALSAGIIIDSPCNGEGTCGKCRVRVTKGVTPPVYGPTQSTECYSGTRI